MLEPRVIDIPLHVDDRGTVHCVFDNLNAFDIKRTYIVRNWSQNMIRAWHGHEKAHTYMHVINGAAKLVAKGFQLGVGGEIFKTTLSADKPQLFYVPSGWYNGAMALTPDTKILVYSTSTFEEVKDDNIRGQVSRKELDEIFLVRVR